MDSDLVGLVTAYQRLLMLPPCEWRIKNQAVYCSLRDEIARRQGKDPELVQNENEAMVNAVWDIIR